MRSRSEEEAATSFGIFTVAIFLELGGAVSILAAFTLGELRLLDQHSLVYLVPNLVGSAVLAVIAFAEERWGFLLLEGVWPRFTYRLGSSLSGSCTARDSSTARSRSA